MIRDRILPLIILVVIVFSCKGQKYMMSVDEDNEITEILLGKEFSMHKQKEEISKPLVKFLKKNMKNFELADIDETFNTTDLTQESVPNKRFKYAGLNSTAEVEILVYEQGGIAMTNILVVAQRVNKKLNRIQIYSFETKYAEMSEIKSALNKKEYLLVGSYSLE